LENLKKHASMLPEPSPELLYPTSDDPVIVAEMKEDRSRNFMIRTTEKEPELVQTILDQLLREQGTPLLKKIVAHLGTFDTAKNEVRASISFFKEKADAQAGKDPNAFAAPTFVKSLLNREFHRAFGKDEKESLPFVFEVLPEGESDSEGKHSVIKVTFSELKEDDHRLVKAALDEAVRAFENRPSPDRLENFDSALATETRLRAMWAILASWAAMLVYLWFRFGNWTFGLAAVICLIHDLCFTLGAIAGCYFVHGTWFGNALLLDDFKLDLTSVAALLTLVGYSCSDTIVVFDRIREVRGKNPDLTIKMLNDSVNQTLGRTILASLTVWLVVFVLYVFGGPGVHLFGFVMVIGVIVGTYSSIYIAAPLLLMFGEGKHEDTPPQEAKVPAPAPAVPSTAIKA
jgi:SecD/SecF fusion protein